MDLITNRVKAAFRAAEVEVAARGGLFGCAGYHAKAFCNKVVGVSPALKAVAEGFGNPVAEAWFVVRNVASAARNVLLPNMQPPGFCP